MNQLTYPHQYIDRTSLQVVTEKFIGDRSINFLYTSLRESAPYMFKALTSKRMSALLGYFHYDLRAKNRHNVLNIFQRLNIDWRECVEPLSYFDSGRKVFERKIRYWETRPMERCEDKVTSPADARVLIGSFSRTSSVFIKNSFFEVRDLLGIGSPWHSLFAAGDFAVFRLTPDKYHYNHTPVSGRVVDFYSVDGQYHSCNPTAQIAVASLYAKNRRVVTVIDTDVEGGSGVGTVVMVEIVALMIGDIVQAYSQEQYDHPMDVVPGMFLKRGCPKSLYRPGSSTDVLLFEPGRISFSEDLVANSRRHDVNSRFTLNFGMPLVETDIKVRSTVAGRALTTCFKKGEYHV